MTQKKYEDDDLQRAARAEIRLKRHERLASIALGGLTLAAALALGLLIRYITELQE